jgi:hypothetical protein
MNTMHGKPLRTALLLPLACALLWSGSLRAQVPVDDNGNPVEAIDEPVAEQSMAEQPTVGDAGVAAVDDEQPPLTPEELEALVGPIALYPDKLLAIVLPASTYPLEIVQAARFLEQLEQDSSLEPDESWDDSVTALLNYPEVVRMMNDDIDWTWRLGEAVVRQQPEVIAAVESFRDKAYAAGNLKSDEHQNVSNNGGAIEIEPIEEDVIYVPYYEPEHVVHYQPRQVYYYYPRPYPVYYYPYPMHHSFSSGYFWGVTTAFSIGWTTDHLHVFHDSYWGHPYYGRQYFGHYYRRPSITVYNRFYPNSHRHRSDDHHRNGDYWRPRDGGPRPGHYRARLERFDDRSRARSVEGYRVPDRSGRVASGNRAGFRGDTGDAVQSGQTREGFAPARRAAQVQDRSDLADRTRQANRSTAASDRIRFRPRNPADSAAVRAQPRQNADSDSAGRVADRAGTSRLDQRRDSSESVRFRSRSDQAGTTSTRPAVRENSPSTPDNAIRSRARSTDREVARDRSARALSPPAARPAPSGSGFRASPDRGAAAQRPNVSRPQAAPPRAAPAARATTRPQASGRSAPTPRAASAAPRPSAARAPRAASAPRADSDRSSTRTRTSRDH